MTLALKNLEPHESFSWQYIICLHQDTLNGALGQHTDSFRLTMAVLIDCAHSIRVSLLHKEGGTLIFQIVCEEPGSAQP